MSNTSDIKDFNFAIHSITMGKHEYVNWPYDRIRADKGLI